jgi:hypothetical protein
MSRTCFVDADHPAEQRGDRGRDRFGFPWTRRANCGSGSTGYFDEGLPDGSHLHLGTGREELTVFVVEDPH